MLLDLSGQNLSGRSFKGQDLSNANFSGADIRSCDFSGANLTGANFSYAKAGLRRCSAIESVYVSSLLPGISGILSTLIGSIGLLIAENPSSKKYQAGVIVLILLLLFWTLTVRQSLIVGALAVSGVLAGALAEVSVGVLADSRVGTESVALVLTVALAGVGALALARSVAKTLDLTAGLALTLAGALALVIAGSILALTKTGAVAKALAVSGVLFSAYFAWQAIKGNEKYSLSRGTSFREANLTDADFTAAQVQNTDFRKAVLIRTCFLRTSER
ncbi:pentapeptide repeat-containing protein [Nostoc sp. MG11]|uniref:pentapeptide repeat-containing protein n=1 Tax=Nostoc sp. MG11 TaxID=2721166 RepID=UPI001866E3C8|nr:pentapeptide repeat-containing protein [Nostoc sp. MG11]